MKREKHIPYFELVETFKAPECPVCHLVKDRRDKYFNTLVYEHLTDKFFRAAYNAVFGFCNDHAHKFLEYTNGAGIAIVHESLLDIAIEALAKGSLKGIKRGECKMCVNERTMEMQYLSTTAAYFEDEAFKRDFLSSQGLCVPHYAMLEKETWGMPKWFHEFHLKKFRELRDASRKFIDSTDFTKKVDITEEEKGVWKKVIPLLYGYRGQDRGH